MRYTGQVLVTISANGDIITDINIDTNALPLFVYSTITQESDLLVASRRL